MQESMRQVDVWQVDVRQVDVQRMASQHTTYGKLTCDKSTYDVWQVDVRQVDVPTSCSCSSYTNLNVAHQSMDLERYKCCNSSIACVVNIGTANVVGHTHQSFGQASPMLENIFLCPCSPYSLRFHFCTSLARLMYIVNTIEHVLPLFAQM